MRHKWPIATAAALVLGFSPIVISSASALESPPDPVNTRAELLTPQAAAGGQSFADVPFNAQFANEIYWLANRGVSTGWTEADGTKTYRPLQPVNRDAMAAFMYRLAGSPTYTAPSASPFKDVPAGSQFYKEITWLASQGISTGWTEPDGTKTYRPLQPVNRDAMAAFMYRYAGSPAYSPSPTSPFRDVPPGAQFYKEISWLASQGISTGWVEVDETKTYRPLLSVNRDAMAAFMYRYDGIFNKPLTVGSDTLPPATVMAQYQAAFTAAGGTTPYSWALTSGDLPSGLSLDPATGVISGKPAFGTSGETWLEFKVTDAKNASAYFGAQLSIAKTPLTNVKAVITSDAMYSAAIKNDGSLWTWGAAATQIQGVSSATSIMQAREGKYYALESDGTLRSWDHNTDAAAAKVADLPPLSSIAAGASVYAVGQNGSLWAWGDNTFGTLGNGTTTASETPAQVPNLSGVHQVASNYASTYAVLSDGTVRAWGRNYRGQLGNGTTTDSLSPVQVHGLTGVVEIVTQGNVAIARKSDGTVWAWGDNSDGQLGNGTTMDSTTPVRVQGLTGIVSIGADNFTGYALKNDGTAWAWGSNSGTGGSTVPVQPTGMSNVTQLVVGWANAYVLKADGTIWGWGYNAEGNLGNGTTTHSPTPVQAQGISDVKYIAASTNTTYAVKKDGTVWGWGMAPLGNGTQSDSLTPVQVLAN